VGRVNEIGTASNSAKEKLEIVLSAPIQGEAGGRAGVGGIPPVEPSQFRSDIFKQIPSEIEIAF